MSLVKESLNEAFDLLKKFISEEENIRNIENAGAIFADVIRNGNKIISFGNGGSMSDAMHFAEEMTGRFRNDRPGLPAIAISDASHITCAANDYGFESIFSRFIEALGNPGDAVLAISTSGNSANVINAVKLARAREMRVVALTGKDGGLLAELADQEIRVGHHGFSDRIQEIHIKIIHILIEFVEKDLF